MAGHSIHLPRLIRSASFAPFPVNRIRSQLDRQTDRQPATFLSSLPLLLPNPAHPIDRLATCTKSFYCKLPLAGDTRSIPHSFYCIHPSISGPPRSHLTAPSYIPSYVPAASSRAPCSIISSLHFPSSELRTSAQHHIVTTSFTSPRSAYVPILTYVQGRTSKYIVRSTPCIVVVVVVPSFRRVRSLV